MTTILSAQSAKQHIGRNGLAEKFVEACIHRLLSQIPGPAASQRNQSQRPGERVAPQSPRRFDSIYSRHVDINENNIRGALLTQLNRFSATGARANGYAFGRKQPRNPLPHEGIVICIDDPESTRIHRIKDGKGDPCAASGTVSS
ncbi:MAG TPA: hypothetical protein VGO25_12960 [Rhodanobacteraceae bacterium]|nr:hypothetical protein [Rhodanobacteraceae bacterium]